MLSRINYCVCLLVLRFNELSRSSQLVIFILVLIVVVGLGVHFGVLSKGNPGNHIPSAWRHSY